MLAVFPKTVGSLPEALKKPHPDNAVSAMTTKFLNTHFLSASAYPNSVSIKLGSIGFLAYSLQRKITLLARSFSCKEGIFCIFQGHLDNSTNLKEKYGLTIAADEASITVEAYRALRDRVNNTRCPELVIKEFEGLFGFIVIDIIRNTIVIGSDNERSTTFFWGTDVKENLVFSDDHEIVKQACHTSLGPFPKNCLFTTHIGLRNLEHPMYEMKSVDIKDNAGEVWGTKFEVDTGNEREAKYRRRGSNTRTYLPYFTGSLPNTFSFITNARSILQSYLQNIEFSGTIDVLASLILENIRFMGWIHDSLKDINLQL